MPVIMLNEEQTLELLAHTEETLGVLYQVYARHFAEDESFYAKLAKDEGVHARWVRSLLPRVQSGQVVFLEGRFTPEIYVEFHDYLLRRLREAEAHPPARLDALAIAVDIETTFIERNFYQVFEGTDTDTAHVLRILSHSADAHQRITRERWQLARLAAK